MPRVPVPKSVFQASFLNQYSMEELEKICFDYGMEYEIKKAEEEGNQDEYIFETAANRPDLLSFEGILAGLKVFLGISETPNYTLKPATTKIVVKQSTTQIREYVVCAIMRNITFNADSYQSFIDLQTKLHFNLCRKRRLVAIGTHDLDKIQGPFVYDAKAPADIDFQVLEFEKQKQKIQQTVDEINKKAETKELNEKDKYYLEEIQPLIQKSSWNGIDITKYYETDKNYEPFVPIIKSSPVYPIIYDNKGEVLSLPPIINGDYSKMSADTKNVFIECTATDYTRAVQALNVLITTFSQYCATPFEIEAVDVSYEYKDQVRQTPDLSSKFFEISVKKVQQLGTFQTNAQEVQQLLKKMQMQGEIIDENRLKVEVPSYRSDILQECDIVEDVCIAFGYNKIQKVLPSAFTVGQQQIINKLSDLIRYEVAAAGYQEGLNFALNNVTDLTTNLRRTSDDKIINIQNPRNKMFTCGRTTLIPGCLKWLNYNRVNKIPIRMFELSDVVLRDESSDTGARNERRLCALFFNTQAKLEEVIGLLDIVIEKLFPSRDTDGKKSRDKAYKLNPTENAAENPTFFPKRQAEVVFNNQSVGSIGILHPEVLKHYHLEHPVSLFEINLEPLFKAFLSK